MPKQQIAITREVLAWALVEAGMGADDLAERAGLESHEVQGWLDGESQPTVGALNKIANVLKRPRSFFLRPYPPQSSPAAVSLRVPYGEDGERELATSERVHIRAAIRRQKIAKWALGQTSEIKTARLPPVFKSAEQSADGAREWAEWAVSEQLTARNNTEATQRLRRCLEANNILILQLSMGEESCRGFSVFDQSVPLIVYNSSGQASAPRSFTILHEFAHLMHGEDAACAGSDSAHERWCDDFAASFLMPRELFKIEALTRMQGDRVASNDLSMVRALATKFKVSYQSVALRLFHLELASFQLFEFVRAGRHEEPPGFARGGQETPLVRLREYGSNYVRLLVDAWRVDSLSEADLRKYLEVDGRQLTALVQLASAAEAE